MISPILALFLVFGAFLAPFQANASLFSLFGLGEKADASDVLPVISLNNSQNMELLAPSFSPLLANQSKSDDKSIKEDSDVNIASNNALIPATSSMGANFSEDVDSDQISVYVVRKNDSLSAIADMFDVSPNTILWANDMKKGDKLVEGDTLIILPISGIKHVVTKGQTLKGIATKYKADIADIASFNGIAENAALAVGDELIIPDGQIVDATPSVKTPKKAPIYIDINTGSTDAYFIRPLSYNCPLTQGQHDRYAIDIGCPTGTPIKAAASGTVIFSKNGYNGGFGNFIIIKHSNGVQTFYAHQSKRIAQQGDQVSQGEVIGYVGSTGRSTGPHLHFEVRGMKNPGFDRTGSSWKKQ